MRRSPLYPFISALVFILLEAISVFLVYEKGFVQRNRLQTAAEDVSSFFAERWNGIACWFSLRTVNDALAEDNASLLRSNFALQEAFRRSLAGRDSLLLSQEYFIIPATVLSNSIGKQHNYMILNRGTENGVKEGMGVVTTHGLIGYVERASAHYSKVLSMLDIDAKFSVILKKNGTFGSLSWDGAGSKYVKVYDMPLHTEVTVGDTLVSSGYSAIFPYGIPIGTISDININDGINYELDVALFEDFHSLRYVYVVGLYQQQEITSLMKEEE